MNTLTDHVRDRLYLFIRINARLFSAVSKGIAFL